MSTLAVYKFHRWFGRQGSLEGVFVEEKEAVLGVIGKTVYLGEVLGKHSEVIVAVDRDDIQMITDDPAVVSLFQEYDIETGINPVAYYRDMEGKEELK